MNNNNINKKGKYLKQTNATNYNLYFPDLLLFSTKEHFLANRK